MRITIDLDEEVVAEVIAIAQSKGRSFEAVVNDILRVGLKRISQPIKQKRYRTRARPMGLRSGLSVDNIQELLANVEGDAAR